MSEILFSTLNVVFFLSIGFVIYIAYSAIKDPILLKHLSNQYLPSSQKVFSNGMINWENRDNLFEHLSINALHRKDLLKWMLYRYDYSVIVMDEDRISKDYYRIELENFGYLNLFIYKLGFYSVHEFRAFQKGIKVPVPLINANPVGLIRKEKNGKSYIGGIPDNFTFPNTQAYDLQFEHIACISREESDFEWLPMERLHIIHPLLIDVEKVYLDYSDPSKPLIIDGIDVLQNSRGATDQERITRIDFEKTPVTLTPIRKVKSEDLVENNNILGQSGTPYWAQDFDPSELTCPKSGKLMKFVCQFSHYDKIPVDTNSYPNGHPHFKFMDFWGDGELYVFMEPESKTVLTLIQNS